MTNAVADLQAAVANLTTLTTSSVTLLNQLNAKVQAGDTIDPADIEAQVGLINAQVVALQTAVTADTPAPAASGSAPASPSSSDPAPTSAPTA